MVQFSGFAYLSYFIQIGISDITSKGFPHSEISGSKAAGASPKHIAANHVLHRLLMPNRPL